MAILKFKDENGNVQEILALRGAKGERGVDAYEKVREYGYEGTEEEFYLAMSQHGTVPDTTLTKAGVAADAAVVGTEIAEVKKNVANTDEIVAKMQTELGVRLPSMQGEIDSASATANSALATANDAATTTSGTTTLYALDWAEIDGGYYRATLDSGGLDLSGVSDSDIFVGVNTGADQAMNVLYKKAFSKVVHIAKGGAYDIEVYSTRKPDIDIPILIKVVK